MPSLKRMFSWARVGIAVNFLSARSPRPAPGRLYIDPARVLSMALEISPAVRRNHNYLPNDFTVYLYREPAWQLADGRNAGTPPEKAG